jgi:FkbM family methyltransferase
MHGDYRRFEFYEGTFTDKFFRCCENKIVVDCGMCYGYYTALALRAGAKHVYGFEPNEELHGPHLKKSFGSNDRVTLCFKAASNHAGTLNLLSRPGTLRSWSATKEIVMARGNPNKQTIKAVKVPCTTLDLEVPGPVGVIKCDTEGGEATIFHGAERILKQKPSIFLELHKIGTEAKTELDRLLSSFGYSLGNKTGRQLLEAQ